MTLTVSQAYTNLGGGEVAGGSVNDRHMVMTVAESGFSGTGGSVQNLITLGAGAFNMASGGTANACDITFQFLKKKKRVTAVKIDHSSGGNGTWSVRASQDGLSWTTIGSATLTSTTTEIIDCSSNTTAYSYYQLRPTTNFTSMSMSQVYFELSGNQYEWGNRTSGSLVTCTASVSMSGGGVGSMFDGDLTANGTHSWWSGSAATGATLQFDFADPVELTAIYSFDTGGGGTNGTWKVEKWNGSSWDEVCAAKAWDMSSVAGKTWECTATGASTRYRMLGTAGSMDSGPFYQEFGFDINDSSVIPSVNALAVFVGAEIVSDGDGSNAVVPFAAAEIINTGDGSSAQVPFVALEIISTVALAPTRAVDGGKIYSFEFVFQPESIYSEADWDSIYSIGDRVGNGSLTFAAPDWPITYGDPTGSQLGDDDWSLIGGNGFTGSGDGSGVKWPAGASITWRTADGNFLWISGMRFFNGSDVAWPGGYVHFAGYDGTIWARNTLEFDDFVITGFPHDSFYNTGMVSVQYTPSMFPWNFWTITLDSVDDSDDETFPPTYFGPEMMFKVYHSILDGGDRRDTNLREAKRVSISVSSGINPVCSDGAVDPLLNLVDGGYGPNNSPWGKSPKTTFLKAGVTSGGSGTRLVDAGEWIQFNFHRKVFMREMVWNVAGPETLDGGGNPTVFGRWQWQASNAPSTGFINIGSPFHFGAGTRWMKSPKPINEGNPSTPYQDYLYPYWRMVLVDGPAFGDTLGQSIYQIQFNLVDPDNQVPIYEAQFSDNVDDALAATLTVTADTSLPTDHFLTDGTDDVLTAEMTVINNLILTAEFSDGDSDILRGRSGFEPATFVQTFSIVKGR